MVIATKDGRVFAGTAEQIVQSMRSIAGREDLSLDAYIDWCCQGQPLAVPPGADRASRFLAAAVQAGLLQEEKGTTAAPDFDGAPLPGRLKP